MNKLAVGWGLAKDKWVLRKNDSNCVNVSFLMSSEDSKYGESKMVWRVEV